VEGIEGRPYEIIDYDEIESNKKKEADNCGCKSEPHECDTTSY